MNNLGVFKKVWNDLYITTIIIIISYIYISYQFYTLL